MLMLMLMMMMIMALRLSSDEYDKAAVCGSGG